MPYSRFFSGMKDEYRNSLFEKDYVDEFINLFFRYKFPNKQKLTEIAAFTFFQRGKRQ